MVKGRLLLVAMLALPSAWASGCSTLFGLEDRPLVADGAAPVDVTSADAADVTTCVAGGRWCETFCPRPEFCDDFDDGGPLDTRWSGGTIISSGGVSLDEDPAHRASGLVLFARASAEAGVDATTPPSELGATGVLIHALGTSQARGLRARYRVRFVDLGLDDVRYADAAMPGPSVAIAGFVDPLGNALGLTSWRDEVGTIVIGVVLRTVLRTNVDSKNASRRVVSFEVNEAQLLALRETYTTFEMAFGPPDLLAAHGFACPTLDAGVPYAVHATLRLSECGALPELTDPPVWLVTPTVSAGALLTGTGNVTVALDGVAVDHLR